MITLPRVDLRYTAVGLGKSKTDVDEAIEVSSDLLHRRLLQGCRLKY
jgi:hypothetical protein